MALVTVLRVQGSSYRQPGARMLVDDEGESIGSVSGGCLERDLILRSKKAFAASSIASTQIIRYDTTEDGDEHETLTSVALGCQGVVDISLEILPRGKPHAVLEALKNAVHEEKTVVVASLVSAPSGFPVTCGSSFPVPAQSALPLRVREQLTEDLRRIRKNEVKAYFLDSTSDEPMVFLLERITPPQRWVVFGASHDSVPLVTLGKFLGWHVTVVDCHSAYAVPQRLFSGVDERITCAPAEISTRLPLDRKPLCALVTHNYHHDLEILKQLLAAEVGYIGLLGPRKKGETILHDLQRELPHLDPSGLIRLHSPAGIDTGAEDPAGIALSIATEALAVSLGRDGGFLSNRRDPIHARDSL
jgi:xanthine/CO dehydrogenase XdhC/CoxF family maturation factor